MELDQYLLNLEKNLLFGSARWVADFTESFRHYSLGGMTFDMVVTGKMRAKGFLLSRLVSYLLMPNYYAACLVYAGELDGRRLRQLSQVALDYAEREELRWVWLVLPQPNVTRKMRELVTSQGEPDNLGLALVDLEAEEVTTNGSYMGNRLARHVRCFG